MPEALTFHFEGALADSHRMNFYECARFQYAAARLMVKLAQFRSQGKFAKNITNSSNFNIELVSQSDGSFNINIEDHGQSPLDNTFVNISLADLIAYVSERVIEKVDEDTLSNVAISNRGRQLVKDIADEDPAAGLDKLVQEAMDDKALTANLPGEIKDLVKRRAAELYRERRLALSQQAISRIDVARSQKLIAMSAPLISEMATALRRSADTLEITSTVKGQNRSVLFLNRKMAKEIEIASVDEDITPILGDITQFNKDNGWGKLKIENGAKTLNFSIPYDLLPTMRQELIDHMKNDLVYIQAYFVRDPAREVIRLIAVGLLPTPSK